MTCVGIDLGTSYCCAGIWKNDRVEILMNEEGDFKTPSYVSFYDTEHLVGEGAKNLAATNADNVVFSAKRLVL